MIDGSGQVVWALVLLEEEWIEGCGWVEAKKKKG